MNFFFAASLTDSFISAQFLDVLFVFDLYIVNYQFCFVLIHYSLVNDNWFVGDRVEFILRL